MQPRLVLGVLEATQGTPLDGAARARALAELRGHFAVLETEGKAVLDYVFSKFYSNFWLVVGKPNFERLGLGCINAKFCKQILL